MASPPISPENQELIQELRQKIEKVRSYVYNFFLTYRIFPFVLISIMIFLCCAGLSDGIRS